MTRNASDQSQPVATSVDSWTYAAFLVAIVACLWFVSTDLPLGGPNVWAAALFVTLAGTGGFLAWRGNGVRTLAAIPALLREFGMSPSVLALLGVALVMSAWVAAVTLVTETASVRIVGQVWMGASIFVATVFVVTSARRARWALEVIVIATSLSVLFGFAVLYYGDPLWRFWVQIANPTPRFAEDVLHGRIAGIAPRVVNLGYHLVVAMPLALALLLHNPLRSNSRRLVYDAAHFAMALLLALGVYFNTSRSVLLGAAGGTMVVAASVLLAPRGAKTVLLFRCVVFGVALTAAFVAILAAYHQRVGAVKRPNATVHPSCQIALGDSQGVAETVGEWNEDCDSLMFANRHARFYTFSVTEPSLVAIDLTSKDARPYLFLHSGLGRNRQWLGHGTENHYGGVGENARLVDGLMTAGDYTVEATTMFPEASGKFALTITTTCADEESLGVIGESEIRTSAWSHACRRSASDPAYHARYFSFTLATSTSLMIEARGVGLNPVLHLVAAGEAGDGVEIKPANLRRAPAGDRGKVVRAGYASLSDGDYRLEVTPEMAGAIGNFTLKVLVVAAGEPLEAPSIGSSRANAAERTVPPELIAALAADIPISAVPFDEPTDLRDHKMTDRSRLVAYDATAYDRIALAITALRYGLEFPFGTGGKYAPQVRHVNMDWGTRQIQAALAFPPHNQFLFVLVSYGVPGLALLIALYGGICRSLGGAGRNYWRSKSSETLFLLAAPAAAIAGYSLNSLFLDQGPFTKDWYHFVLLGLMMATVGVVNRAATNGHRRLRGAAHSNRARVKATTN